MLCGIVGRYRCFKERIKWWDDKPVLLRHNVRLISSRQFITSLIITTTLLYESIFVVNRRKLLIMYCIIFYNINENWNWYLLFVIVYYKHTVFNILINITLTVIYKNGIYRVKIFLVCKFKLPTISGAVFSVLF